MTAIMGLDREQVGIRFFGAMHTRPKAGLFSRVFGCKTFFFKRSKGLTFAEGVLHPAYRISRQFCSFRTIQGGYRDPMAT